MMHFAFIGAFLTVLIAPATACAFEGFDETFNGNGSFATTSTVLSGLDNPNWTLVTKAGPGSFDGAGYNFDIPEDPLSTDFHDWLRQNQGDGSFREIIRLSAIDMGWYSEGTPVSGISMQHALGPFPTIGAFNSLTFGFEEFSPLNNKLLWRASVPGSGGGLDIPLSPNYSLDFVELGIEYNRSEFAFWFWIDSPLTGRVVEGPFSPQETTKPLAHQSKLHILAADGAHTSGRLDNWSLERLPDIRGDVNDDGALSVADVDVLSLIIRRNGSDAVADLSLDGMVDRTDLGLWIHEHQASYYGDANLDGHFNSQDLTLVFQTGEYEDLVEDNSGWAEGDWNADAEFTSSDLVVAFQDGGYEKGAGTTVNSVPEPSSLVAIGLGLVGTRWRGRRYDSDVE